MGMQQEVIISSRNRGKLAEFAALLSDLSLSVVSAADRGVPEVEETGTTLAQNALLKAEAAFRVSHGVCIADDSGLFVEALAGAPGIYSARFAGENVTYADNTRELLRRLEGVPQSERGAAFVSVMALLVPEAMLQDTGEGFPVPPEGLQAPAGSTLFIVEGRIEGIITTEEKGEDGFGYDPLFYVPSSGKTFAEMEAQTKNRISHRAKALRVLRAQLEALQIT